MTFSDSRVVDFAREHFTPVWESAAPIKVAIFDLGDGKEVKGTLGGEIALWFCRPDGTVFDVLPGLQSPAYTLEAMQQALAFYEETGATDEAIREHHGLRLSEDFGVAPTDPAAAALLGPVSFRTLEHQAELDRRRELGDPATATMAEMALSKVAIIDPEPITVVEPGGLPHYRFHVHRMLALEDARRTPDDWKLHVFETILHQDLSGGTYRFDSSSQVPISVIE